MEEIKPDATNHEKEGEAQLALLIKEAGNDEQYGI